MGEVLALHGHVRGRRRRHPVLRLLLPVLQAEDVVRLQVLLLVLLLNHLLRVLGDVVVMREGPPLLLLLLLVLHLVLQLLLVPLGPRRVPLPAAPLVPVVGVDVSRVPRLLVWRPINVI